MKDMKFWVASLKRQWGRRQLYKFRIQKRRGCSISLLPVLSTGQPATHRAGNQLWARQQLKLLFWFLIRTNQGNSRNRQFLSWLWILRKNQRCYSGLQKRGERKKGGFTMQHGSVYEHIARKVWRDWWTDIYGSHALLLLLPMEHARQIRKPKSKSSSMFPGREPWTTVMLLRKSKRKIKSKQNKPQNKQSHARWNEARLQCAFLSGVLKVLEMSNISVFPEWRY